LHLVGSSILLYLEEKAQNKKLIPEE
jgi:hypothetical protein